jgi:glycosyltransferase involved in cell wall biosynthesis
VAQVDIYSGSAFVWAEAVCQTLQWIGKPYVLTLHGGGLPLFAAQWSRRVRRLLGSAFAVTTPSGYLLEEMLPYRSSLTLIPNAIDVNQYEFRQRIRPRPDLVWLRSLHQIYNPVLAIRVLAALRRVNPDARLVMIGPDKGDGSRQQVEREAAKLGVTDCLTLTGVVPKNDVPGWLSRSDIFLNTANLDNMPVSVLEALACGLCIVSTNVGGIPHLLDHQQDALLTTAGNADEMIAAVHQILADSELAASLSVNARFKAERFDWSVVVPAWQAVLQSAFQSARASKRNRL